MDIEQEIIRLFFQKDRQERLYWELSGRKRSEFFWHLSGVRELKPQCLHDLAGDRRPLKQILRQSGAGETVYFLGSSHMGSTTLEDALHRAAWGELCLIYLGNGVGYWQGEPDPTQPRSLLFA